MLIEILDSKGKVVAQAGSRRDYVTSDELLSMTTAIRQLLAGEIESTMLIPPPCD